MNKGVIEKGVHLNVQGKLNRRIPNSFRIILLNHKSMKKTHTQHTTGNPFFEIYCRDFNSSTTIDRMLNYNTHRCLSSERLRKRIPHIANSLFS